MTWQAAIATGAPVRLVPGALNRLMRADEEA